VQHRIAERVANQASRLARAARFQLLQARQRLDSLPVGRTEWRMTTMLHRAEQQLDDLGFRMEVCVEDTCAAVSAMWPTLRPLLNATTRASAWPRRANG